VIDASFACGQPQVSTGLDGFPYFNLQSPEASKPFEAYCLCSIAGLAIENGHGVAINSRGNSVDWVFSYGDILTLHMFQTLELEDAPPPANLPQEELLSRGEVVLIGQPSETYLPQATRSCIRAFLEKRVGVKDPGVYLMHRPNDNPPQQLVFSVFRNDYTSDDAFRAVLQGISWFLPRHYVVVALQSRDKGVGDFAPL
jgi:hypothetical protein